MSLCFAEPCDIVDTCIVDISNRLSGVETKVEILELENVNLKLRTENLEVENDQLELENDQLKMQVSNMEANIGVLENYVDELEIIVRPDKILASSQYKNWQTSVEDNIESNSNEIDAIKKRTEKTEQNINSIGEIVYQDEYYFHYQAVEHVNKVGYKVLKSF